MFSLVNESLNMRSNTNINKVQKKIPKLGIFVTENLSYICLYARLQQRKRKNNFKMKTCSVNLKALLLKNTETNGIII